MDSYAQTHHEHLPLLERVTSISEFHDSNPLLFWTVLRTSSYRNPKSNYVFDLSSQAYQHLLGSSLLAPIRDFRTIQAIIILCYWPNSGARQSQDPSWQYCGIALNSALQMGLSQEQPEKIPPGFGGRFNVHQMSVHSRHMTWLACFYISTRYGRRRRLVVKNVNGVTV